MDGSDDMTSGFPLSAFCHIYLQFPLAYVNQITMFVTTNIHVNGPITQLEGNTGKYGGRGSITVGGRCRELVSVTSVEGYSIREQET